jgi:chromosomal replication initiation ATPase DnaA
LKQLSFSLQVKNQNNLFAEEDFLPLFENITARNFLKKFFAQKDFSSSPIPSLIIKGPSCCGKSHLLNIFARKFNAEFIKSEEIIDKNFNNYFISNSFYILENIDEIIDEEFLLCIINLANESNSFLILTTKNIIEFHLKDLTSRLKNIQLIEIKNPQLESIKQLLINAFSRRQIKISDEIINFITSNIDRTYEAIFAAVKSIEFFCNESGKKVTMGDVKKIL